MWPPRPASRIRLPATLSGERQGRRVVRGTRWSQAGLVLNGVRLSKTVVVVQPNVVSIHTTILAHGYPPASGFHLPG